MSDSISSNPEYRRIKSELDDKIRELAQFVTSWTNENGVPGKMGNLVVTGWLLPIAVSVINDEGEFDDLLQEASSGINTYMATGVADVTHDYWSDAARGFIDDEDD